MFQDMPSKSVRRTSIIRMDANPLRLSICMARWRGIKGAVAVGAGNAACHGCCD